MRDIPEELRKKQDAARQSTLDRIQSAINELNDEGYLITTKLLIERTGLARSTFSKPHVQELLKFSKIGKYKDTKTIEKSNDNPQNTILRLENDLIKSKKTTEKLQQELSRKNNRISRLEEKLNDTTEECQLLRGQFHLLMQKAKLLGFELRLKEGDE